MRLLCALLVFVACASSRADSELDLERRLLAPCCWRQTIEDHDSNIATSLRSEIHQRIARGERPAAIEADLVRRYGEQIRVVPTGAPVGAAVLAIAALGLFALLIAYRRRVAPVTAHTVLDDRFDDRLDDELAELD